MTDHAINGSSNLLLSGRAQPLVGWAAIDEFEDLFSALGAWRIAAPVRRRFLPKPIARVRDKSLGAFDTSIDDNARGELLLVVARAPGDLEMLSSIRYARRKFGVIAGYVIDSFRTRDFGSVVRDYDHVFSTTKEGAEAVLRFGVSSSVLRQGVDCLNWASVAPARCIDLIGFGRQPPSYHREFQHAFHRVDSPILYLHSPIGALSGKAIWDERPMLLKLLQHSKLSLAFNLAVEPQNVRPRAATFVTSRWFESLAAGCVVVGKRPTGDMVAELFSWPDALLDLPDDPKQAREMITCLVEDAWFLEATRARNVLEMCSRHDWRYRIRDIYNHFGFGLPARLSEELRCLSLLIDRLRAPLNS